MDLGKPTFKTFVKVLKILGGVFLALALFLLFAPFFYDESPNASQVMAISNAKQTAQAARTYSTDYDDKLPLADSWMDILTPFFLNDLIFRSPAISKGKDEKFGFAFQMSLNSANYNGIKSPEREPIIFDSTNLSWNAAESLSTLTKPGRYEKADGSRGNTISFCDGHARFVADTQDPRKG